MFCPTGVSATKGTELEPQNPDPAVLSPIIVTGLVKASPVPAPTGEIKVIPYCELLLSKSADVMVKRIRLPDGASKEIR